MFYLSLYYLINKLKKFLNKRNLIILVVLISFEPTILQWHSSFWSESIYLSMFILLLGKLINVNDNFMKNIFIGLLIGIMFAQRSASFLLIVPILIFYIINFKKKINPCFFLLIGYFTVISLIGLNHYIKKDRFFILPYHSQLYSNYHYMLHEMTAKSEKKGLEEALNEKVMKEKKWIKKNKIEKDNFNHLFLIINYRNKEFLNQVIKNPIDSSIYLLSKISQAAILDPFWVKKHLFLDKTVKSYHIEFNKDITLRIVYSIIFYTICLLGLISIIKSYLKNKYNQKIFNFLFLNLLIIFYFYLFAGGYGVSRYFVPTLINFSFFFIFGINFIFKKE